MFQTNIKKIKQNRRVRVCLPFWLCLCEVCAELGCRGIYISTWHSQNTYISFHLIFSDFMFILWWGALAGDVSGDSHPGLYFHFEK